MITRYGPDSSDRKDPDVIDAAQRIAGAQREVDEAERMMWHLYADNVTSRPTTDDLKRLETRMSVFTARRALADAMTSYAIAIVTAHRNRMLATPELTSKGSPDE